jgi:ABC-2 type transport system permease protein
MSGWFAVYYRELLILKRRFFRQVASMAVAPLLYLIAFGLGMGGSVTVDGHSYMEFLIPGLIAMTSMTQAFAIASEINVARFYWRIFEEFQAAPIRDIAYVTGEVMAGITRALLSAVIIILLSLLFGISLSFNLFFWLAVVLNSFVFASLAVCLAMLVKAHGDQFLLTNFIITPMAFLGGTFFPVERMPPWVQNSLHFLPITHAAKSIRAASYGKTPELEPYVILAGLGLIFFALAFHCVNRARD